MFGQSSTAPTRPRRPRLRASAAAAALVGVVIPVLGVTTSAHADAACTSFTVICPSAIYFGASVPGMPRNLAGLKALGTAVGKQPTVGNYFAAFGDQLDVAGMATLAANKRLPMVTWSPDVKGNLGLNPYPLASIANGTFDTYLTRQGRALATVPGKVVVRFAHEMNGNWFPWGRGVNGNTDAQYVAAYRHVHAVLAAAGATNIIWAWSPAVVATPTALDTLYPGSDYVDWVAPDLYLDHPGDTVGAVWPAAQAELDRIAGDKPIFIAETGVTPGPNRAAQITDLFSGLLHTPRLVGISWFDEPGRYDWRVDDDSAALNAIAAQLANPWFTQPGATGIRLLPPLSQALPVVTGTATVDGSLTATPGAFRSLKSAGGTATVSSHWYRCPDTASTTDCEAIPAATDSTYTPVAADWTKYLRYRSRAVNSVAAVNAWSAATGSVMATPATPAAPAIVASNTGLTMTFPPVPFGATHWLITRDNVNYVPVPVGTATYPLTGLTAGQQYQITLRAADITPTATLASPPVSLTASPLKGPSTPYVVITGSTALFQLPRIVPAGTQAWLLTVDGQTMTVPTSVTNFSVPNLTPGDLHSWSFAPVTGTGGPAASSGWGAIGAASSSSFTTVATPALPTITPVSTGAVFTFPALPAGATGWLLTVGAKAYPVTTDPYIPAVGFPSTYPASWTLRAVNSGARSDAVTGRFTAG